MALNEHTSPLPEESQSVRVKCLKCCHVWIVAYLPLECSAFAKLLGRACCPNCANGPKDVVMASAMDVQRAAEMT